MERVGGKARKSRKQDASRPQTIPFMPAAGERWICYATRDYRECGTCGVLVLRLIPGEREHVMLCFVVDLWCMGLKQAFGRLGISVEEFQHSFVESAAAMCGELELVDVEFARRIVAGGTRFARDNGFILPPRYECWTALLEVEDNVDSADVSDFGVDGGGLRFIGSRKELKARLVDGDVKAFLSRPDVEFEDVRGGGPVGEDDFENAVEQMRHAGLGAVRQWCFAHGRAPHPQLPEAWDVIMESVFQMHDTPTGLDHLDATGASDFNRNVQKFLELEKAGHSLGLSEAIGQILEFTSEFGNVEQMLEAIHIDETGDEPPAPRTRKPRARKRTSPKKPPA